MAQGCVGQIASNINALGPKSGPADMQAARAAAPKALTGAVARRAPVIFPRCETAFLSWRFVMVRMHENRSHIS